MGKFVNCVISHQYNNTTRLATGGKNCDPYYITGQLEHNACNEGIWEGFLLAARDSLLGNNGTLKLM